MRRARTLYAAALFTILIASPAGLVAAEARLPVDSGSPASLVRVALESELLGPSEVRGELLKQALTRDPNFAPARWQSGFVRWDGQWLTPEQVAERAISNPLLAEYRKRRDAMVDKADDHQSLALWCQRNKLVEEANLHWMKVLEFEPTNEKALAALGLQMHNGRLLTRAQIEQAKKAATEQRMATQRWQPQILKRRTSIERGTVKQRTAAIAELTKISDPAALPILETVLAVDGNTKTAIELNQLFVRIAGGIPSRDATAVLLRRSLISDPQEVREAAADQLKKRPLHVYVPQLIAALPGSLSTRYQLTILPNGTVVYEHQVLIKGQAANVVVTSEATISPGDTTMAMFLTPVAAGSGLQRAAAIEAGASTTQARLDQLRDRIQFVLERTTGFGNVDDPDLWQKLYNDYNGWDTPVKYRPTYEQSAYDYRGAATPSIEVIKRHHSCFAAGTQVLTLTGPTPIENIKSGDRVLSQNIETGELVYQPVEVPTLRPTTPLLEITIGSERLCATPGHPFWVTGEGWRTAQRLKVGDCLRVIQGVAVIERIEEVRPREVYNLVVNESHDFFVGASGILVHDNSALVETAARVPGLIEKP